VAGVGRGREESSMFTAIYDAARKVEMNSKIMILMMIMNIMLTAVNYAYRG
jgi:hypothetical protein